MILGEWLDKESAALVAEGRTEGRLEALLDILTEMGSVPKDLQERLQGLDEETLRIWTKFAVKVESMDDFLEKIK